MKEALRGVGLFFILAPFLHALSLLAGEPIGVTYWSYLACGCVLWALGTEDVR